MFKMNNVTMICKNNTTWEPETIMCHPMDIEIKNQKTFFVTVMATFGALLMTSPGRMIQNT